MDGIDELEADARAARDSAAWNADMARARLDPATWLRPVRDAGQEAARAVERLAREHPVALATGALGVVALLAARARPQWRAKAGTWGPVRAVGTAAGDVRDRAAHAAADLGHAAAEASRRTADAAHHAREKAADAAHAAGQYAQDLARAAAARAESAMRAARHGAGAAAAQARTGARWARHEAEAHPAAAIAAGLAVGAALALLLAGRETNAD
jgi:ElaB/YqjD/DUF883 family membrane-anchored ribosome-binding protein